MELRCPDCHSPEVGPHGAPPCRCLNCGAELERDSALVAVGDISCPCQAEESPEPVFSLDGERAAAELRDLDGAIEPVTPFSDADELNSLLYSAVAAKILRPGSEVGRLAVYPVSVADLAPLLGVDLGTGPVLLGSALNLRRRPEEDPITYTVRFLEEVARAANDLAAGSCGEARRLDRIADYMNASESWNGTDLSEFVRDELLASGRGIREAE